MFFARYKPSRFVSKSYSSLTNEAIDFSREAIVARFAEQISKRLISRSYRT